MSGPGTRVLVGGVGYPDLCDHSVGVLVVEELARRSWPAEVTVEDVSYGPIAVMQRLNDEPPDRRFRRAILVSGVSREGRAPGSVSIYRWDCVLPPDEEVQRAVNDAVTGVIFLDNTLIVTRYFGGLPDEVTVVEVEPLLHAFGDRLSAPVAAIFADLCERVATLATVPAEAERLPVAPLGGAPLRVEA